MGRLKPCTCAGVVTLVLAVAPASAHAATMSASPTPSFQASPGETNTVVATYAAGVLTVEDPANPLVAGPGCDPGTSHLVRCTVAATEVWIALGDADDSARVTGIACRCSGGADDDTLIGGSGADLLNGEHGDDSLNGSFGADQLLGGKGVDTATYEAPPPLPLRSAGVVVTIDGLANDGSEQDGPAGARDNVRTDVERVVGTDLHDELTGSAVANVLAGGRGNDRIDGGFGPDDLNGGFGTDQVLYTTRSAGVRVDIQGLPDDGNADDGPSGARDNVQTDVEDVSGGGGPDTLLGSPAPNSLWGGKRSDTLDGRVGDDILDGGTGPDLMLGGDGRDTATYEQRDQAVTVTIDDQPNDGSHEDASGNTRDNVRGDVENVLGGSATDRLTGSPAPNKLIGGPDDDILEGGASGDSLKGGTGGDILRGFANGDTLEGGDGPDTMRGGAGVDTASYADHPDGVTATLGGLSTNGNATDAPGDLIDVDIENLTGANGGDVLTGDDNANRLRGVNGDDILDGGRGPDVLDGGLGLDEATWASRLAGVMVSTDGEPDDGNRADGPAGARDNLQPSTENVVGGPGNDTISGAVPFPFPRVDNTFMGGGGADALFGGGGDDSLDAGGGDDTLSGSIGDDTLDAGDGDDTLSGGPNHDRLIGASGADDLDGGSEKDVVSYEERAVGVTVTINDLADDGNSDDGPAGARDNVRTSVENVNAGEGSDDLTGDGRNNGLRGGPGDDRLLGADGDDTLEGAAGLDRLDGGFGIDHESGGPEDDIVVASPANDGIFGGEGVDMVDYSARTSPVEVDLSSSEAINGSSTPSTGNVDDCFPHPSANRCSFMDTIVDVENAIGGQVDDLLIGDEGANVLTGGAGADRLLGRAGDDTLDADDGEADEEIDCQEGSADTALVDALDPATLGCETVVGP